MSADEGVNRREFLGSAGATAAGVIAKRTGTKTEAGSAKRTETETGTEMETGNAGPVSFSVSVPVRLATSS